MEMSSTVVGDLSVARDRFFLQVDCHCFGESTAYVYQEPFVAHVYSLKICGNNVISFGG